jgi:hypothetical protein
LLPQHALGSRPATSIRVLVGEMLVAQFVGWHSVQRAGRQITKEVFGDRSTEFLPACDGRGRRGRVRRLGHLIVLIHLIAGRFDPQGISQRKVIQERRDCSQDNRGELIFFFGGESGDESNLHDGGESDHITASVVPLRHLCDALKTFCREHAANPRVLNR